jgi:hypothetical protein
MTSRELTNAIDQLIALRIHEAQATPYLYLSQRNKLQDDIEMTKRLIADALKLLDHRPGGVYGDGKEP